MIGPQTNPSKPPNLSYDWMSIGIDSYRPSSQCRGDELSTAQRACNFRSRCTPPLGDGYCRSEIFHESAVRRWERFPRTSMDLFGSGSKNQGFL